MHIWVVTVGEPLPADPGDNRRLRTGILADMLAEAGHEVTWWSSTFNHQTKTHRFPGPTSLEVKPGLRLELLHAPGYKRNVSWERHRHHALTASAFALAARQKPKPEVILCSLPTLELSLEAARLGKALSTPVVLDIRDLWPDVFLDLVPKPVRSMARVLLRPSYARLAEACRDADAVVGVTDEFVQWGLARGHRSKSAWDRSFPLAYPKATVSADAVQQARRTWQQRGVDPGRFNVCFFGTFGRQFDIPTVIAAAKRLEAKSDQLHFILCGDGEQLPAYRRAGHGLRNLTFPGWVSQAEIQGLMGVSSVGLAPYLNTANFVINLPNKPVEYLSAGLPIVTSLEGSLKNLIDTHGCGVAYGDRDSADLAEKLLQLSQDRDLLAILSANAKALFERAFVAERVYPEMVAHLETISREFAAGKRRRAL